MNCFLNDRDRLQKCNRRKECGEREKNLKMSMSYIRMFNKNRNLEEDK